VRPAGRSLAARVKCVGEGESAGGSNVLKRDEQVLVAGAGGFIGGHLVRYLADQGFTRIRAVDLKPVADWFQVYPLAESVELDLRSQAAAHESVAGCSYVVNLATDPGGAGSSTANALSMLSVVIHASLLVAARDAGVSRYFYSSSACVYPEALQASAEIAGLREEGSYPAMPRDGCGWEKLYSERLCRYFREDFGLATRMARYHDVYGSHGPWDGGQAKAPVALCRKVAEAALAGKDEIEIWGDGSQTGTFMHVDDCVRGTLMVMEGDLAEAVNLGSAEVVSADQMVDAIEDIASVRLKRRYNISEPGSVRGRSSDNALLRSAFGWEPSIRLRDGLAGTYRWVYDQVSARSLTGRRG
jgi:GDP-D-mannose 3', 5'-epimerase